MPAKLRLHAAPATVVSLAVILALTAIGLVAVSRASTARSRPSRTGRSPEAAAKQPKCGDTITTDTTLHHDLVNCPNNGILIGADNITLNLNGHTIDGDGKHFAGCAQGETICDFGVVDPDSHDGLTVRDGSVREFVSGLALGPTRHSRVLGVSAARNKFSGIFCLRCDRSLVRNSAGNRTKGFADQVGMFLLQSHHDRILHSTFRGNVGNGHGGSGGGILSVESTNTVIRGNLMSRNGEAGIIMEMSHGFHIRHNRLVRNYAGIELGPASHNAITRNHISRGSCSLIARRPNGCSIVGIDIEKGHGNLVAHNVVAHTDNGIRLGYFGSAQNVVRRNLVKDGRKDGFLVGKKDRHSRLKGNVAKRSGDDGFDIESRSAKLTRNRAVRNADLGIEAVFSVIDGGGNIARHNGDPRQCVNIVCN
jgi:parallel beta-helix repeat protein